MLLVKNFKLPNHKLVDFSLEKNQGFILRGQNGSGKTLLLKGLANLYPTSYEIFSYQGKSISTWNQEEYRSQVLYIPSVHHSAANQTAEDFLKAPFRLGIYRNHAASMDFDHYLKKWNLKNLKFSELSSGQKQCLSFLRGLSLKSKILLLDEPFSHLDQTRTLELETLLLQWKEKEQGSFILVSHSDQQAERMSVPTLDFHQIIHE